ncbi:SKI/DACH domain-containing protein 1-like [Polypterus senegalus]
MDYNCNSGEGGFQTGFQEIDGINMGYLKINGRQMFALAQVFSDLFKDIPRTTINKRMEVLNIRSRRCDIKELRSLKAIHSVPVRAVTCSLIAKEDLELLYAACQTLSPKKRKKRRKSKPPESSNKTATSQAICTSFCKTKTANALFAKDTGELHFSSATPRQRGISKSAQNFSKLKRATGDPPLASVAGDLGNYEKVSRARSCYRLKGADGLLVAAGSVNSYRSAIAVSGRSRSGVSLCLKSSSRYGSAGRCDIHNGYADSLKSPPLLLGDKSFHFAKRKDRSGAAEENGFKKVHGLSQIASTGYFSDSESGSELEKDSDFGSNFQSTSTESSDEEDSLDRRSVLSSSSEGGSSSESDSSSVYSGDSVQSTRYRQAALPTASPRYSLPNGQEEVKSGTCDTGERASTKPPVEVQTGPLCTDVNLLLPKDSGVRCAPCSPGSKITNLDSVEKAGNKELHVVPSAPPALTGDTNGRSCDKATLCVNCLASCTQGNELSLLPKIPPLEPEGSFLGAVTPLENGNCAHKGTPNNGSSLGLSDQAESQIEDLSQESGFHDAPPSSSRAPIHPAVQNCTGPGRICIATDLPGDIKEPRREKFERLIRTSKLWCYAKGFNFDGKNVGYTSSIDYRSSSRPSGRKGSKARPGSVDRSLVDSFFPPFTSPRSKGRCTLSSNAFKVNGSERNLKRSRTPRRSGAERQQRCSKEVSKRVKNSKKSEKKTAAPSCYKRKASASCGVPSTPVKRSFALLDNFPCPPSLVVGADGDLCPAYSLCSKRCVPHQKAAPHCRLWQLGGNVIPVPPSHKFRGYNLEWGD